MSQTSFPFSSHAVRNEGASKIGEVEFVGVLTTYDGGLGGEEGGCTYLTDAVSGIGL